MSRPSTEVPSRNSTAVTLPSGSDAAAVMVIVGFHGKTAPSAGDVMLADGGWFDGGGGGGGGGASLLIRTIFATDGTPASSTMKSM